MSNQLVITAGAKVRNLSGVLTGTSGVVNSLPINASNGIPQLDVNGKILVSQLPNSVMEYLGTWNAATNTPTLANGTGNQGDVYLCNVAGTVDFGAGAIAFVVGDQVIYSGSIWQRASGATGTVTSVAITESGDSLNITGSPITTSGTINIGFNGTNLQYVNGAGNLTTFPILTGYVTAVSGTAPVVSSGGTTPAISMPAATASVDGYLDNADWSTFNNKQNAITLTTTGTSGASTLVGATLNIPNYGSALTGYVPYTGATANVDLGTFNLTADVITGATGSFASNGGSDTFAINHSSGAGIALNITKGGSGEGLYINKTSGSGNAATIIGTLNATTLVKSGGTSSQFLKADGTVDSSTYALDSAVVHNTGNETVGGTKTFSDATKNNGGIFLQNASSSSLAGYMNLGGLTNGVKFTSGGGVSNTFTLPSATGYTFTFPNATGTLALTSDISYPVTSVFGRTGAVVATSGDYTTTQVTEGTNLYYTDVRARASNSFVAGSGAYNSTTGVITIPTDNSQIANGAGYITSSALSGYLPLTGGTLTGPLNINVSSGTAMNVAGNAIFRGDTGVGTPRQLIISSGGSTPVYLEAKGYGANYQTDFGIRTFNNVGTSFEVFYADSSGRVGINQVSPSYQLDVNGTFRAVGAATFSSTGCFGGGTNGGATFAINNGTNEAKQTFAGFSSNLNLTQSYNNSSAVYVTDEYRAASYSFKIGTTAALTITSTGNVLIGTTTIAGYKVDIRSATGDADINIQPTIGTNAATLYLNNTGGGTYFGRENSAGGGLLAGSTPYATIMRSTGTNPIQFGVNNSVNFTIVNGGNVGIGTSSPTIPLQVNKAGTVNSIMTQTVLSVADSNGWNLGSDGTNALIGVTNSGTDMLFLKRVAGVYSEAMRITSGGALCLGVTSAYGTNLLNVNGGIYATSSIAAVVAADIDMFVFSNTGASYSKSCIVASITATGGTGSYFFYGQQSTSSVALKIFSNGNIQNTNNSYGAISDARLKENIKDATPKLDDLMKVKVRNYNLKGESNKQLGVISQELEAIFPNMIEESTNMGENMKIKGVKYSVFVPMLIKAVQELKQEIEILKNK
jgi:hypothetical protein